MDLTQLANLGEFIGGVAVLVTLIYLAIQVRQGTAALASSRHHDMLDSLFKNSLATLSENRDHAEFVLRAQLLPEELDETDWYRFVNHAFMVYGMWEDAYISHGRGLIDDEFWSGWDGAGRLWWTAPGFRKFWEEAREGHTPVFQKYIDTEIFPRD